MEASVVLELQGEGRGSPENTAAVGSPQLPAETANVKAAPVARQFLKRGHGRLASHLLPRPSEPSQEHPEKGKQLATRGLRSQSNKNIASGVQSNVQNGKLDAVSHKKVPREAQSRAPVLRDSSEAVSQRPRSIQASTGTSAELLSWNGTRNVALPLQGSATQGPSSVEKEGRPIPPQETPPVLELELGDAQLQGGAHTPLSGGGSQITGRNLQGLGNNQQGLGINSVGYNAPSQRQQSQGRVQSQGGARSRPSGGGSSKAHTNPAGLVPNRVNQSVPRQRQKPAWDERFWKTAESGTSVMVAGVSGQWLYRHGGRASNDDTAPAGSGGGMPGGGDRGAGGMQGRRGQRLTLAAAVARRDIEKLAKQRGPEEGWEYLGPPSHSIPLTSAPQDDEPGTAPESLRKLPETFASTQHNRQNHAGSTTAPSNALAARSMLNGQNETYRPRQGRSSREVPLPPLPREDTSYKAAGSGARMLSPGPFSDSERPTGGRPRAAFGGTPLSALLEQSGGLGQVLAAAAATLDQEAGRVVAASRQRRTSGVGIRPATAGRARADLAPAGGTASAELAALQGELARETGLAEGLGRLTESAARGGFRAGIEQLERHLAGDPSGPAEGELRAALRQLAEASLAAREEGEANPVEVQEPERRGNGADRVGNSAARREFGVGATVDTQELGRETGNGGSGLTTGAHELERQNIEGDGKRATMGAQELERRAFGMKAHGEVGVQESDPANVLQTSASGANIGAGKLGGGWIEGHGVTRLGTGREAGEPGSCEEQGTWGTWQRGSKGQDPALPAVLPAALYLRQLREAEELEDALRAKWLEQSWPNSPAPRTDNETRSPSAAAPHFVEAENVAAGLSEQPAHLTRSGDMDGASKLAGVAAKGPVQQNQEHRGGSVKWQAGPKIHSGQSLDDSLPRVDHHGVGDSANGVRDASPLDEVMGLSAEALLEWCNKYVDELVDSEFRTPPLTPRTTLQGPHGAHVKTCAA